MTWVLGGRKLFVVSGTGEYLVNHDGTVMQQLSAAPNEEVFFSPDGTRAIIQEYGGPLTYPTCCGPGVPSYSRIDIVDLASGKVQRLTQR